MQYVIDKILEVIAEREPSSGNESIILINGFDRLDIYAEIASKLQEAYKNSTISLNVKLAKRKWLELKQTSNTTTIQQMLQNGWVSEKESVTFYRNQHNVNMLVLLGTEDEDDIGGLANCFTISPDWLVSNLDGHYSRIFEKCFVSELSEEDKSCIDSAYAALFAYRPINICKLSNISESWVDQFETINEFSEEFGKDLPVWGVPGRAIKPFNPRVFKQKTNFLREEIAFISGKLFQKMTTKTYKTLIDKIEKYKTEGTYADIDWTTYQYTDYDAFTSSLLEFARGENVQEQRNRLLKVDFVIIKDILDFKIRKDKTIKTSVTTIVGEPIYIVLRTALSMLRDAKINNVYEADSIHFDFFDASVVTGFSDVDDDEKKELLESTWKNICVHFHGIFEFINRNSWQIFSNQIKVECDTPDFFDPLKVLEQMESSINVATGNNKLNKIYFKVKVVDKNGSTVFIVKDDKKEELSNSFVWTFDNEASWLYDFKSLIDKTSFKNTGVSKIPVGVMSHLKNTMIAKGEEEFFGIYEENLPDLNYDITDYVRKNAEKYNDFEFEQISAMFTDLGHAFSKFVTVLFSSGFYSILCTDILNDLNEKYKILADKILSVKFDENKQWVKDAFLQAFTILDKTNYLEEDIEPECIIVPPWHPATLQKIADQKGFLLDGIQQKIEEYKETQGFFDIEKTLERFLRMTEIQSSLDLFPATGNDYMGILGTYGHFCVYGNENSISSVKTRIKDIIRKEAIYDEEFSDSELTQMNDDAKMIYDVLIDYNKALPSVKSTLSIVFINPPKLQPIVAAISKYTEDTLAREKDSTISLKLSVLVRPENKGGKNYLTYWMNEYFSEEEKGSIRIYLNEWTNRNELDKLLSDNNDIVFNMDLLHAATFKFIPNLGAASAKISDCRFPIVYKPSPLSKTSKRRKIEITQTQFSAAFKHTQVARYKKNPEVVPNNTSYLAVRETTVDDETKSIINMLHKKAYWVVCIDKVMDGALLRTEDNNDNYAIIGFSTGKGMYGQYNLTVTAKSLILDTVKAKLKKRIFKLFKWKADILDVVVNNVMNEARSLDGISVLSAINQKSTNINEFMAYVMTSLREKRNEVQSALKVIIHLDSYKHWFDNSSNDESSMRPDFLMLSVTSLENLIKLKATVLECKTASYNNSTQHIEKAKRQVQHGLKQLKRLFDPNTRSIERRYWYAQLYRALVFAQVTFSDSSNDFEEISGKLRSILDGNFEIEWEGKILGYWVDQTGSEEVSIKEDGITICNIPQECIQKILSSNSSVSYIPIDEAILSEMNVNDDQEQENAIINTIKDAKTDDIRKRRKKASLNTNTKNEQKQKEVEANHQQEQTVTDMSDKKVETELNDNVKQDDKLAPTSNEHANEGSLRKNIDDLRVLIGRDRFDYNVYWEYGNKGLSNRHLLITGTSGQGKTYGIQTMLYEVSKSNVSMVVFDYTEGFREDQLEKKFLAKMKGRIDNKVIYFTGVPIDPFKRHEIEVAGLKAPEKISDVAQRIASTLTHVYKFGDQQFAAIYEACYSGLTKFGENMTMKRLEEELNSSSNKSAKSVVSKMTPFLHSVEFSSDKCNWENILYSDTGKLTIFQLTNFVRDIQVIITEFMLWDMWHYSKKNGSKEKPFVVVLDEAQNLSHAENSPSGLILTEGRKFGWSAWYATQSLKVLNDDEVTRLLQSAFRLYFKPTNDEIISIAKQLNPSDVNEWKTPLNKLKKGECIVVGDRIQKDGLFKPGRPTVTKVTSFEERE